MSGLNEKWKKDELKFERMTNESLKCKDCTHRFDDKEIPCNTSKCEKFGVKANKVLLGGDCDEYERE